jgi:hypothetical protein
MMKTTTHDRDAQRLDIETLVASGIISKDCYRMFSATAWRHARTPMRNTTTRRRPRGLYSPRSR